MPLIAFIGRTDVTPSDQMSAVAVLLRVTPDAAGVNEVVSEYLFRATDLEARLAALQAIRVARADGDTLRAAAATTLDDSRNEIQRAAINRLTAFGADYAGRVVATLERVAQDGSRSADVRAAAETARRALAR